MLVELSELLIGRGMSLMFLSAKPKSPTFDVLIAPRLSNPVQQRAFSYRLTFDRKHLARMSVDFANRYMLADIEQGIKLIEAKLAKADIKIWRD